MMPAKIHFDTPICIMPEAAHRMVDRAIQVSVLAVVNYEVEVPLLEELLHRYDGEDGTD